MKTQFTFKELENIVIGYKQLWSIYPKTTYNILEKPLYWKKRSGKEKETKDVTLGEYIKLMKECSINQTSKAVKYKYAQMMTMLNPKYFLTINSRLLKVAKLKERLGKYITKEYLTENYHSDSKYYKEKGGTP